MGCWWGWACCSSAPRGRARQRLSRPAGRSAAWPFRAGRWGGWASPWRCWGGGGGGGDGDCRRALGRAELCAGGADRRGLGPADRAADHRVLRHRFPDRSERLCGGHRGRIGQLPAGAGRRPAGGPTGGLCLVLGQRLQGGSGVHRDRSGPGVGLARRPPGGGWGVTPPAETDLRCAARSRFMHRRTRARLTLAALALLVLCWGWLPDFSVVLLCHIALYALVALGLVLLTGIGGMTSFGQAAFVGIGAYATAWVCTAPAPVQWLAGAVGMAGLPWVGLALGLALTTVMAWGLGAATLRLSGHSLPLCTIAWGLSLYYLFGNMSFLGGQTGITGVPPLVLGGWSLAAPRAIGLLIWALLLLALWLRHTLLDWRAGRAIRALKGARVMAESMGVDTARYRIRLFVLAALLAALSGWLYAHLQRFVSPTPFNLHIGIEYLFMAVVGGAGHLGGAVLGATLITLLKEKLQDWLPALLGSSGNFELIVFGLLMVLVLQRFTDGLWPMLERLGQRCLRRAAPRAMRPTANPAALTQRTLPPPGTVLLQARNITKRFGGLLANDAVSMDVRAGQVHALIGPNGAGKSSFFNIISGLDEASAGDLQLMGQAMRRQPPRPFARLGLARSFQHVRLLGQRSVLENVALGAHLRARGGWLMAMLRLDRAQEAALLAEAQRQIERCGLAAHADAPVASLALGQQRIAEIAPPPPGPPAPPLPGQPALLLLDEPAAGLRHLEKQVLAQLLRQLRAEGLGLVVVEHDMEFVMQLADHITVLDFGCVIAEGNAQQVQRNPQVLAAYLGG